MSNFNENCKLSPQQSYETLCDIENRLRDLEEIYPKPGTTRPRCDAREIALRTMIAASRKTVALISEFMFSEYEDVTQHGVARWFDNNYENRYFAEEPTLETLAADYVVGGEKPRLEDVEYNERAEFGLVGETFDRTMQAERMAEGL